MSEEKITCWVCQKNYVPKLFDVCITCKPYYEEFKKMQKEIQNKPPGQLRRWVNSSIGDREFEIVVGTNTYVDEDMFAVGEIVDRNAKSMRWIHLKRSDVKKLIKDFEIGARGAF